MRINMCAAIIAMQSVFLIGAHVKAQQVILLVLSVSPLCQLCTKNESRDDLLLETIILWKAMLVKEAKNCSEAANARNPNGYQNCSRRFLKHKAVFTWVLPESTRACF